MKTRRKRYIARVYEACTETEVNWRTRKVKSRTVYFKECPMCGSGANVEWLEDYAKGQRFELPIDG